MTTENTITAMEAVRKETIKAVLRIIDEIERDTGHVALIGDDNKFTGVLCNSSEFRDRVKALKGEQG